MRSELDEQRKELDLLKETVEELKRGNANAGAGVQSPGFADAYDNDTNFRIAALEAKFDLLTTKLTDFCTQFNPDRLAKVVATAAAQASCDAVLVATKEAREIESKKLNVVVYGLPPSNVTSDIDQMKKVLADVGCDPEWAVEMWRDGPAASPGKFRFCKLTLSSVHAKSEVLKLARNKKFAGLYIRRDLTFNEREARRKAASLRGDGGVATSQVTPRMHVDLRKASESQFVANVNDAPSASSDALLLSSA
jgi:hypothetical protein